MEIIMNKVNKKVVFITIFVLIVLITCCTVLCLEIRNRKEAQQEEYTRQLGILAYRNNKFNLYQIENDKYDDYQVDVAFLCDSLTDLYDLERYYPQYVTANRGIGGDTTFGLQDRLQLSLFDLKPKVAVMLIGANNPDTMLNNYEDILVSIKQNLPDTKVVLLSLTSMGGEHWGKNNQIAAYNNVIIKMLADKYNFEYVDLYSALLNVETGEIYQEFTTDGGHLTHEGYVRVTEMVTPVLDKILN